VSASETSDLWWKNAVVYCLDVETYLDWNGDGIGDLNGLTERIDYLAGMGVSCLWLMPFHPSPNRDDGYDVIDYYAVDPSLGNLGDFVELIRTAKDRGLRVIIDLVVNHTSDQHLWFQDARSSRDARYRDFYVWSDEPPEESRDKENVFPDAEDSIWSFDEEAGQWYLHHFYSHQPDLNIANPEVRDEIAKIAGFWLQLGVDGFRVDAVPYLLESTGKDLDLDPHRMIKELRSFIARRRGDAVLLGEVNLEIPDLVRYFGDDDGDELQMLFAFPLMQLQYLAFVRHDARPLADHLRQLPAAPDAGQWAMFIRNHDELTLDKLTDDERQEVFAAFGPEPHMQLFDRGLRRRLPPMLDGDDARIRLAYSLLFSLPGTPVLYYGEEIGMGENLEIEGRMSVRTPMQWAPGPHGGFSPREEGKLCRPMVTGDYGPDKVNVNDQRHDPDSLLNWMERVIRRRRETPALGFGTYDILDGGDDALLVHRTRWRGDEILVVHNFAADDRRARIDLAPEPEEGEEGEEGDASEDDAPTRRQAIDLLDHGNGPLGVLDDVVEVELGPYGYRWFRILPTKHQPPP
jgi:trehalose synthase